MRSEQESAGEWTSEGGPNGKPSRGRRESHPLSIGARMMVRVSERTCKRQFGWYRRSISFCPMSGAKAVFYFRLAPAQPKRSSAAQTFYIFGGTQNEEQHDEEAPDHDSCLCHDPVSGRLRQQGRIPRRQLCRPEHRRPPKPMPRPTRSPSSSSWTTPLWTRSPTPSLRSWIRSPPIRM